MKTKRCKQEFKVGDKVTSRYASPWSGIILSMYEYRNEEYSGWICSVLAVIDKNGERMRKPKIHRLNQYWLMKSIIDVPVPENFKDFPNGIS